LLLIGVFSVKLDILLPTFIPPSNFASDDNEKLILASLFSFVAIYLKGKYKFLIPLLNMNFPSLKLEYAVLNSESIEVFEGKINFVDVVSEQVK